MPVQVFLQVEGQDVECFVDRIEDIAQIASTNLLNQVITYTASGNLEDILNSVPSERP